MVRVRVSAESLGLGQISVDSEALSCFKGEFSPEVSVALAVAPGFHMQLPCRHELLVEFVGQLHSQFWQGQGCLQPRGVSQHSKPNMPYTLKLERQGELRKRSACEPREAQYDE